MRCTLGDRSTIDVRNVRKWHVETHTVDWVTFEVEYGEIFARLGPNGSNKTTTAEIIEGLRPADFGTRTVLGLDVRHSFAEIKRRIGPACNHGTLSTADGPGDHQPFRHLLSLEGVLKLPD